MSANCCYVAMLYTIPRLWRSSSKLAEGQMANPSPQRTVGVRGGHEGAGKRALSHAAQQSESRLSAVPGDRLTSVWIRHSRGNGWNLSHGWKAAPHVYN